MLQQDDYPLMESQIHVFFLLALSCTESWDKKKKKEQDLKTFCHANKQYKSNGLASTTMAH